MKTLYESILDDEDVLISDVKKTTNPFVMINNLVNSSSNIKNDIKTQMEIKRIFNEYIADSLPYETRNKIRLGFLDGMFRVFCSNDRGNEELIFVVNNSLEAAKDLNTHKGDKTAILFLDAKAYRKLVTEYGFKNTPDYHNWIKYITAKYKLNKSNDKYVYTI